MLSTKLYFDLNTRKFLENDSTTSQLSSLQAKRGDRYKYELIVIANGKVQQLPGGAILTLGVKDPVTPTGDYLAMAEGTRTGWALWSRWIFLLDLDTEELNTKIASTPQSTLGLELQMTFPDNQVISSSNIQYVVENDLIRGDETALMSATPGLIPKLNITRLIGGTSTDLDAQPISSLAARAVIMVITDAEGTTFWRKELWLGAPSPITDVSIGRIVPPDFNNTNMNYVLIQKS